eukprot:gene30374-36701_t
MAPLSSYKFLKRAEKEERDLKVAFVVVSACLAAVHFHKIPRGPSLLRRRWDEERLRTLAEQENSFVREYRMTPYCFDVLLAKLGDSLRSDEKMAAVRSAKGKLSAPITESSRLGAALILLGGGRHLEAMRTHGMAYTTVYHNFQKVIRAINEHPDLAIQCDNSLQSLKARAAAFQEKCTVMPELFKYCTGAIDGLAIEIICPRNTKHQTRYYSGSMRCKLQIHCHGLQARWFN